MLALEEPVPQAVIYHCGAYLVGDKNFNCFQIQTEIVKQMGAAQGKIAAAETVRESQHQVATVWSLMVAQPMSSHFFNSHTLFNTLKSVNTEASAILFKKKIGILKHCEITPAGRHFEGEGQPTELA